MNTPPAVLVVDDSESSRELLTRRLAEQGYTVAVAVDGQDALDQLAARPFDLVLLDIVMPRVDGREVLARLKADPALRHVPVIVLSMLDDAGVFVECLQAGAEDYLQKPINATILNARVGASLARKRLHDEDEARRRTLEAFNETLERRVEEATASLQQTNRVLERRLMELAGMIDVARSIISVLDLRALLTGIMDLSKRVVNAEASSLLIADPETRTLRFHVAAGGSGTRILGETVEFGRGIAGTVALTGESVLIPDAYQDPRFDPSYDGRTGFRTHSILTVPLKTSEGVIGVVQALNKLDGTAFDQHDLELFESFASMAGISLQNAKLFDQVKTMADDLRAALEKERWLSIEKEKMGAYIPKHVVDEITRNREAKLALGGKTVRATILFSDIQGFTRLAETLEPQRVVAFLNEYMTAMAQVIEEEGGIIDKFMGDGIMAIFLPADEHDNHALRAVRAGIRMQRRLAELKATGAAGHPELARLQARIGVNTGEVVAGNIGSETRMDYTVVGDNVNLASRVESNGRGGEVHISEAVHLAVKDEVKTRSLGAITVKNRVQPVQIYSVDV
jgi:adenylate cyclase